MNTIIDIISSVNMESSAHTEGIETVLEKMQYTKVSKTGIVPSDKYVAVQNAEGNNLTIKTISDYPYKFFGYAVANPWFEEGAIRELHRAFQKGLKGLYISPPLQGVQLTNPILYPLIETAISYRAFIYVHTGTPICAMPLQLSTLAQKFPDAKFIMGHMGYSDFWYDAVAAGKIAKNIWLETSLTDSDVIEEGIKILGADRFVFGSSYPVSSLSVELKKIKNIDIPEDELNKILYGNFMRLTNEN